MDSLFLNFGASIIFNLQTVSKSNTLEQNDINEETLKHYFQYSLGSKQSITFAHFPTGTVTTTLYTDDRSAFLYTFQVNDILPPSAVIIFQTDAMNKVEMILP